MYLNMIQLLAGLLICSMTLTAAGEDNSSLRGGYPITPVPFTSVSVGDGFWGQRLKASREVTIPLAFSKCEETGRYDNFVKATHPCDTFKVEGSPFDDTDVYKTIEGASYLLQTYPDQKMEAYIDSVLTLVAAAQEPDGYLNTSYTMNPAHPHAWMSPVKWEKVEELSHEFYNLGHMVEGAVAHYQATGKRNFLDIAIRYADCVCREIGDGDGQLPRVPGHQIAEMALARLYLATGDSKYLDQAKYFLDKRGHTSRTDAYSQAHRPVVDQDEAVGHAVRAGYMYSGMADVAALTGDLAYIHAIDRIWDNIVGKKLYITGGVGATHRGEAFGANYELPNLTAYCETCASIGNVYTNHRLFLLHGQSKYYDVLERTLYNGLISGVSLDGGSFYYPNPLESNGEHGREPWFGCACCPSNISRFIPSLPGYVYAVGDNALYVNLFMGCEAAVALPGGEVKLSQTTGYPRDGKIALTIDHSRAGEFALKLRIPGWVKGEPVPSDLYTFADQVDTPFSVTLNGVVAQGSLTSDGYYTITREWKEGDRLELSLPMEPRLVKAHDKVKADRHRLAVERGPLVYCAEWPDNSVPVHSIVLPEAPRFTLAGAPLVKVGEVTADTAFSDILTITCPAQTHERAADDTITSAETTLTLIPYYAWAHRGRGPMAVWLPTGDYFQANE